MPSPDPQPVIPLSPDTTDCARIVSRLKSGRAITGARVTESPRGYYAWLHDLVIVIPRTYTSTASWITHFHGLRIASWDSTPEATVRYFNFLTKMYDQPSQLLVVPLGAKDYDLDARYGTAHQYNELLTRISVLTGESLSDLTLSGHSAAYRVILGNRQRSPVTPGILRGDVPTALTRVCLFDAMYSAFGIAPLQNWLDGDPSPSSTASRYCYNIAPMSSSTYAASEQVKAPRYKLFTDTHGCDHWELVSQYWKEFTS